MSATATASRGTTTPQTPLRRWLALDALVTTANALAYLAVSGPLGDLLGIDSGLLLGLGAFLLLYGAAVGYLASRRNPAAFAVRAVIEANIVWSAASVAALLFSWIDPDTAGLIWVPAQAATVLGFAGLQYLALRGSRTVDAG